MNFELAEEDKHETAFVVGNWECNWMPVGLTNPQQLSNAWCSPVWDLYGRPVFVCYTWTTLSWKCRSFQHSIKYMWHIISEEGVATDPDMIVTVQKWPATELYWACRGYRQFINKFSIDLSMMSSSSVSRPTGNMAAEAGSHDQIQHCSFGDPGNKSLLRSSSSSFADCSKPYKIHTIKCKSWWTVPRDWWQR